MALRWIIYSLDYGGELLCIHIVAIAGGGGMMGV